MIKLILRLVVWTAILWIVGLMGYLIWIYTMTGCDYKADGIVVLTGADKRVDTGIHLLAEGDAQRLLISGVNRDVKKKELLSLSGQDRSLESKIDLGFSATDTLGNADETTDWVKQNDFHSLIVVTSHYHMPRALFHLGMQLPNVKLYPCSVLSDIFREDEWYKKRHPWQLLLSDYNKFLLTYPQILLLRRNP